MDEQVQQIEVAAKKSWTVIAAWIGGISAVIGFIGTIGGGVTWLALSVAPADFGSFKPSIQ